VRDESAAGQSRAPPSRPNAVLPTQASRNGLRVILTILRPADQRFRTAIRHPTNRDMPDPFACMEAAGHPVDGVLHVGGSKQAPLPDYRSSGASPCIYVDPRQEICDQLSRNLADDPWHIVVLATRSEQNAERNSDGGSFPASNVIDMSVKTLVVTRTLDDLAAEYSARRPPNFLVIDSPELGLSILRGGAQTLPAVDGVYVFFDGDLRSLSALMFVQIQACLMPFGLLPTWLELDRLGVGQAFFSRAAPEAEVLPTFGGNLARGKWAAQSSLSQWSRPTVVEEAQGAVNGQITGDCSFHTDTEDNPWWFVDLGKIRPLNEIRIYNRPGPYRVRARTLKVVCSVDAKSWTEVHDQGGHSFGGLPRVPLRVSLNKHKARYIALRLFERTCLHLDEVEVY